jgi:hypothetical protein
MAVRLIIERTSTGTTTSQVASKSAARTAAATAWADNTGDVLAIHAYDIGAFNARKAKPLFGKIAGYATASAALNAKVKPTIAALELEFGITAID